MAETKLHVAAEAKQVFDQSAFAKESKPAAEAKTAEAKLSSHSPATAAAKSTPPGSDGATSKEILGSRRQNTDLNVDGEIAQIMHRAS